MIELFSLLEETYEPITSKDCYDADGWFDITFGILLTIGIWISWLPQQIEFYRKKSTFGVSSLYIILTQIANWTPFVNALYLDWDTFQCCKYIKFWECQESLITIYQLGISTFSVLCMFDINLIFLYYLYIYIYYYKNSYIFYVIYYDPTDLTTIDESKEEETLSLNSDTEGNYKHKSKLDRKKEQKKQILYFIIYHICTAIVIFIGYMMIVIWGAYSQPILWYSYALGFISAIVVLVQFTPQIYITFKLKTSGSLSLVMLIIQTPGTWIWLVYLVVAGENWSTWLSTLVAAIQVTILLCQVLYYDHIVKRLKKTKVQVIDENDLY